MNIDELRERFAASHPEIGADAIRAATAMGGRLSGEAAIAAWAEIDTLAEAVTAGAKETIPGAATSAGPAMKMTAAENIVAAAIID